MVFAEPMVQAAMTVALSSVCVLIAGPCSDVRTSMSTLQHSTLSVLNRCADVQMLVLFQMQTLWRT